MTTAGRVLELAAMLFRGEEVTLKDIQTRYGVSRPTAKRDFRYLQDYLPVAKWDLDSRSGSKPKVLRLVE